MEVSRQNLDTWMSDERFLRLIRECRDDKRYLSSQLNKALSDFHEDSEKVTSIRMPFLLQFAVSAGHFFSMALVGIDLGYIKKVPADKNLLLETESKNAAQIAVMPSSDFTTYRGCA